MVQHSLNFLLFCKKRPLMLSLFEVPLFPNFVNCWFHFQEENSDDDDNDDPDDEASKSSVDSNEKTEKAEDESKSRSGSRSSTSAPGWFGKGRKPKKQRI